MHLTGRTFSGLFLGTVEIKRSELGPEITIQTSGVMLTVDDQIIEVNKFHDRATMQIKRGFHAGR